MELKRFIGADSKATMDQVRAHYGDDALIISTNKVGNKTEMICAVEEPLPASTLAPNAAGQEAALDISEATSTVASLLNRVAANNASGNPPTRGKSDERIAREFGKELNSALSQKVEDALDDSPFIANNNAKTQERESESPTASEPPDRGDMHKMMATIQADLAQLRNQLEAQAYAESPLRKAQLAMASIKQRVNEHSNRDNSQVIEQVQALATTPLIEQKDWSGVHAFVGYPGAGKSTIIAKLIQQALANDPSSNLIVISLQHKNTATESVMGPSGGLSQLCQSTGVAFLQANDLTQLGQLLDKYRQNHQVFIDTTASLLMDQQALISLITENEILPHLCLPADVAPAVVHSLSESVPWMMSSVVMTRFDLAPDLEALLHTLDVRTATVSGVSGLLFQGNAGAVEKGNLTNTLEE